LQAEQIIDAGMQMHDIVKTLQDGPESVKEILRSEGPWLGEELDKAWENY